MTTASEKRPIRIMLVDDQSERAASVEEKLTAAGFVVLSRLPSATGLLFQIEQHQPDLVLIDLQSPGRDVLESLSVVNHYNPKPVVMFTREDDPSYIEEAVDAGVTAYLNEAQTKLESQSVIEKAKKLLMNQHKIDEEKAHKTLQTLSMDTNQSLPQAAKAVISIIEKNCGSGGLQ